MATPPDGSILVPPSAARHAAPAIPGIRALDSTFAFVRDPYRFISNACHELSSDIFQTRLLLEKTICVTGREAAFLFYGTDHLVRTGAAPGRILKTLVGKGGVQGLDDAEHRRRKALFLSLVTEERVRQLVQGVREVWLVRAREWSARERVVLYPELKEVLMAAVCAWAGVPLPPADLSRRTREVSALFDHAGSIGPRHWWARHARTRTERWLEDLILQVRTGALSPAPETAAHAMAWHRDAGSALLSPRIAAVELLNILRPTVAVAVYLVLVAYALQQNPAVRLRLSAHDPSYAAWFVQEVRRFFPFFPAAMARVREDLTWQGYRLERGRRVLLDLYGTNHDPRLWRHPFEFSPERFADWTRDPYSFIPQGGGFHQVNHRCPGEAIAVELMLLATSMFTDRLRFTIPPQEWSLDFAHMPALPRSRFVMAGVHLEP